MLGIPIKGYNKDTEYLQDIMEIKAKIKPIDKFYQIGNYTLRALLNNNYIHIEDKNNNSPTTQEILSFTGSFFGCITLIHFTKTYGGGWKTHIDGMIYERRCEKEKEFIAFAKTGKLVERKSVLCVYWDSFEQLKRIKICSP